MKKGVMSWGGGASDGEVILGKSFQQGPVTFGGVKAYFSLLPGKDCLLCDRAAWLVSHGILPPPWVFRPQAGILGQRWASVQARWAEAMV